MGAAQIAGFAVCAAALALVLRRLRPEGATVLVIAAGGVKALETVDQPAATQAKPDRNFCYFSDKRYRKEVAGEFWKKSAEAIIELAKTSFPWISSSNMPTSLLCKTFADGSQEIAVENFAVWGRPRTTVTLPYTFSDPVIVSTFPTRVMSQEENCFVVPVPPRGITAVRINPNKK